ncbi:MAG: hypothetical protein SNH63_07945 [Rikenellaceae bacterium]
MKKFLVFLSALSLLSIGVASAQRYNAESILKKIAASDEAVSDPKKAGKASTWIARGDIYYQAAIAPVKAIYWGADAKVLNLNYGDGEEGKITYSNNKEYTTLDYPSFTAYFRNNVVVAWTQKAFVVDSYIDAFKTAIDAYMQAYEIDFEYKKKIQLAFTEMLNFSRQMGNVYNELGHYKLSAESYSFANDIQHLELYPAAVDVELVYSAGYLHVINSQTDSTSFAPGEKLLGEAVAEGYCEFEDKKEDMNDQDRGSIFYYMFHCAYSQSQSNPAKMLDAKEALKAGLGRYPRNENIFDALLQIYTSEEGIGDPLELLETADENIKLDDKNVNAWYGRARICYAASDYDNAIEAFAKVTTLEPTMFMAHYYLGVCYMQKADAVYNGMKDDTYTDRASYDEATGRLNGAYALSIPHFEAAYELKKTDRSTLSYLKQLCFRLRDDDAMMEKYTKYNELYDAL